MSNKTVSIVGKIDLELFNKFYDAFVEADSTPGIITINICSGGGDIDGGTAIYELMRTSKNPIKTVALGNVGSIATLAFEAGDKRVITEGSYLLIHDFAVSLDDTLFNAQAYVRFTENQHNWYCQQISDRSGIPLAKLIDMASKETYIESGEALTLGLVDEIRPYRAFKKRKKNER